LGLSPCRWREAISVPASTWEVQHEIQHLFISALAAVVLSGCGSVPPLNFSVPNVGVSQKKIDAEMKSMTVTIAVPMKRLVSFLLEWNKWCRSFGRLL